jgi:putative aldouronate transport system permease protein
MNKKIVIREKKKTSLGDKIFVVLNTIFMILFVVITLYPVLNTLVISFNDGTDALRGGLYLWPRKWTLQNYITVLHKNNILIGAMNTFARTVIGTLSSLVANAILAYIVSRKRFLFKKELSLFWVITMYVNGGLIPTFLLYKNLGLTNSFMVYVIPGMVGAFNMLVIRTYMSGIPESLEESAQLDGAGDMLIFVKIISPLCKPVYATVALFSAVGHWNSWFDAMLYNRMSANLTTLQYELMKLLSSVSNQSGSIESMKNSLSSVTPTSVRAAATILTILPIVCLYPFLQRYFVTGLTIGGVKE